MAMVTAGKLCWNCDGTVDAELGRCPYCGVDVHAEDPSAELKAYSPPYRVLNEDGAAPPPPYSHGGAQALRMDVTQQEWEASAGAAETRERDQRDEDDLKRVVLPMVMLLSGAVFLMFGLALFLFSENGVLTLRWNARYSPFYLISALPLLYFGWQAVGHIED